jgi:6-pyruvoyltetrahydropterin/6-carboxytetrahydropterin synthase
MVYLTRQVEFAAAHRLYREDWSQVKNFDVFGDCSNPYGHGHNYLLEVTVRGVPDEETGMVSHFSGLKKMLHELVTVSMDHRHLNFDVPFLKGVLPTSENIVRLLWTRIDETSRGGGWTLHKLKLSSTARNWVDYYGPEQGQTPQH